MNETTVWSDMVGNTTVNATGAKGMPLKSTGNEKVCISICLTVKVDGMKMKPFVIFQGAKWEDAALNENFKDCYVVASSSNAWVSKELTHPRN